MKNAMRLPIFASAALMSLGLSGTAEAQQPPPQVPNMTFFVASAGPGKGADLGGLEGADRLCQTLAQAAGAGTAASSAFLHRRTVKALRSTIVPTSSRLSAVATSIARSSSEGVFPTSKRVARASTPFSRLLVPVIEIVDPAGRVGRGRDAKEK